MKVLESSDQHLQEKLNAINEDIKKLKEEKKQLLIELLERDL